MIFTEVILNWWSEAKKQEESLSRITNSNSLDITGLIEMPLKSSTESPREKESLFMYWNGKASPKIDRHV